VLKKIIAIVAFLGILLQTISQFVIVASFYANRNYIAKNLCENRDKPMLHCEGKCCLKKKLAQNGKEHVPTSSNQKSEILVLFCDQLEIQPVLNVYFAQKSGYPTFNCMLTVAVSNPSFHPPDFVVVS
jgi:hypothetical protein